MSISSKRIVSYINSTTSPITAGQIFKELFKETKKSNTKSRKTDKNKMGRRESDAHSAVGIILNALALIGLLKKQNNRYFKNDDFLLKGGIKISTSGNGILKTEDGNEIIIKKENIGNSRNNDTVEAKIINFKQGFYYGRVIRVIEAKRKLYLSKVENKTGKHLYHKLLDSQGDLQVFSRITDKNIKPGDFTVVKLIDEFMSDKQECVVEESYSSMEECFVRRLSIKHSLPGKHKEYEELKNINKIMPGMMNKRKDYRKFFTITIDGENAKDFDDAVSLEIDDDKYKLFVHIADVSAYVAKGSELDLEALNRGTSFYLGNQVIPMLPEKLSNDLCSLRRGEDRLTLSVELIFDNKGNEIGFSYFTGIINVNKRLTYFSADEEINGKRRRKLGKMLQHMFELASILKKKRLSQGRIDLNLPDYELIFKNDDLLEIAMAKRLKSHTVIEEFMLSANAAVSRILTKKNIPALYRVHEDITEEKITSLNKFLKSLRLNIKEKQNIGIEIQRILDEIRGKEFEQVVNFIVLRSFMQAYYGPEPLGHFGLGFADYTHFTSPIRRYPDLVVHRCLKTLINNSPPPYNIQELEKIGEKSSLMERVAQNAERDLFKLISCKLMEEKKGQIFDVVISGISKSGFFITLLDKPIEGMVPLRYLTDDYYLVMEDEYCVIGRRLGRRFRLGDRIKARLVEVDIDKMRIDFDVV